MARALPLPTVTLRAGTVGVEAYTKLRRRPSGAVVHSSYDGAVNITTGAGIVSLVPASAGRGPINITVDGDFRLLSSSVAENDPLTVDGKMISTGDCVLLSLTGSTVYNPSQKFFRPVLDSELVRRNLRLARETAFIQGRFSGLGSLLHSVRGESLVASGLGLNSYSRRALPPLRTLLGALAGKDLGSVRTAARDIAGLGVGLTPSGDDLLAGLLVALALGGENGLPTGSSHLRAARVIAGSTAGLSGVLGHEYVEQASVGRANEKVTKLVEDILAGAPQEVEGSASDLIAMGHSSGTDTLVGVILGVGFMLQRLSRAGREGAKRG